MNDDDYEEERIFYMIKAFLSRDGIRWIRKPKSSRHKNKAWEKRGP
jgi:hypothetical protein